MQSYADNQPVLQQDSIFLYRDYHACNSTFVTYMRLSGTLSSQMNPVILHAFYFFPNLLLLLTGATDAIAFLALILLAGLLFRML